LASEQDLLTFTEHGEDPKTGEPFVDAGEIEMVCNTKFRQAISYASRPACHCQIGSRRRGRAQLQLRAGARRNGYKPDIKKYPHDTQKAGRWLAELASKTRDDGTLVDSEDRCRDRDE